MLLQTTGTFATVNRSETKLPEPTTSTAVKRHPQHQSATVYRAICILQDLATGRAVEQRSTPSARRSQNKPTNSAETSRYLHVTLSLLHGTVYSCYFVAFRPIVYVFESKIFALLHFGIMHSIPCACCQRSIIRPCQLHLALAYVWICSLRIRRVHLHD